MGRPHKRWWDEVGKDSNKMGIKDRQAMVRDHWEWRKTVLVTEVLERQKCLRRRRRQKCYKLQSVYCEMSFIGLQQFRKMYFLVLR